MCLKAKALKANIVKADPGTTIPLSGLPLEHGYVNFFAQSQAHVHIGDRVPKPSLIERCQHRCLQRQRTITLKKDMSKSMCARTKDHNIDKTHVKFNVFKGKRP